MSAPSPDGDAKVNEADEIPPIKREFSRRFHTMSKEDILNNRVGPNVSTHIYICLIANMMKGTSHIASITSLHGV